jgi:hypothetical protein
MYVVSYHNCIKTKYQIKSGIFKKIKNKKLIKNVDISLSMT